MFVSTPSRFANLWRPTRIQLRRRYFYRTHMLLGTFLTREQLFWVANRESKCDSRLLLRD